MTVFERLIAGEIPCEVVYEDADTFAFRDVAPQAPHHVLIVPKRVIARVGEAGAGDQAVLGALLLAAGEVSRRRGVSGRASGQGVPRSAQNCAQRARACAPCSRRARRGA